MNTERFGNIWAIFFSMGMLTFLVCSHFLSGLYSAALMAGAVILLFVSVIILSKNNLPALKLLVGGSFTAALFLQADQMDSYLSAIMGFVMFSVSMMEYRKDLARKVEY
ncbi:hypothetical protein V7O66_09475 [Methanolobus sp. ZRKC3]|uniref:hypothetical protein n=1 Tax=Methanolobus sp. ZRKC3 TaxID=3125786 RepID=UPI003251DFD7